MTTTILTKAPARKKRLTELGVKKLKPDLTRSYLVWDLAQRGLCVRVLPTGSKSWKCVYSRHGKPRWYHIGNADSIGLSAARLLAAEIMVEVARGKDPAAERRAQRSSGSLADLASKYVEQYAQRNNKSWKQADALVRRYVLPRWAKLQSNTITRGDVKQLMASIAAPVLANQVLAAISAIFSWGLKEELVTVNPCRGIDRNATRSRERILSESEIPQFWKAFEAAAGLIASSALKTILLTGQRPGEVAHMRREHIVDNWWTMPGEPTENWPGTKNAQSHRVWLPQPVVELLKELSEDDAAAGTGFVFASSRGRPVRGLDEVMRAICTKLGVERATPHDLRRSFLTKLTGLGFGRDAMNRIANHKEGGISDVYDVHAYETENRKIMEATAGAIMSLIEPPEDNVVQGQFGRIGSEA